MDVELMYSTPYYHKLVEACARQCYNSMGKCNPSSHKMVKAILTKGHLSVASHGNILFKVLMKNTNDFVNTNSALADLNIADNFIRLTRRGKDSYLISMNILTLLNLDKLIGSKSYKENVAEGRSVFSVQLLTKMKYIAMKVDSLAWFLDPEYQIEDSDNPYVSKLSSSLGNPSIIHSDYNDLSYLGLSEHELDVHSVITVSTTTDRAMSLQDARHKDMMARSEMSQRYVKMEGFEHTTPVGIDREKRVYKIDGWEIDTPFSYGEIMELISYFYSTIHNYHVEKGQGVLRANEIARSILPNATLTTYIDSRPLKQWKHLLHLRDDKHAQLEKQRDAVALKKAFIISGIDLK